MSTDILETLPKLQNSLLGSKVQLLKFYKLLKELMQKQEQKLRFQNLFFNNLRKQF